ncbi:MAG TPA: hypothetical protein VMM58_09655 [Bacteroidota bacterium]|nr:hypothetical protein [Bacteroidota bacterium]
MSLSSSSVNRSALLIGSICSSICVVYQSLYRAVPSNIDLFTGLPLGKEFAHPGLYSPYDLVVSSGIRGPFYLYKYLGGFLYSINANVDIVWQCFFVCFLFLTFLALWLLSFELTQDLFSSALVLAFLAVAHPLRGSLHAADVPIQSFVTALAAMPFALLAIVLVIRKQFFAAMALSGLVFNLHPYVGLLTGSAVATGIFLKSGMTLGKRILWIIGGSLLGLPNAIYILTHLSSNFSGVGYNFYAQLRLYALHVFAEDYWREGYGWFFANLAGAVWFSRYIDPWKRRMVWALFMCWFALMGLYIFNSYFTKNTAILLMFLMRATYFIKPIIFIYVIHGIRRWRGELETNDHSIRWWMPWEISAAVFLLFVSSILPMRFAVPADAMALLAYGFLVRLIRPRPARIRLFFASVLPIASSALILLGLLWLPVFSENKEPVENFIVGGVVFLSLFMLIALQRTETTTHVIESGVPEKSPMRIIMAVCAVLAIHQLVISFYDKQIPFVPDFAGIKQRIFIHQAPHSSAALMQWARTSTPQSSLFAICPDEWDDLAGFRLIAERGIFITIVEVNQLSLDAAIYNQGHERLLSLGTKFPNRREYDTRGYYELGPSDLKKLREEHVDYMVFKRSLLHGYLSTLPASYSDAHYVVVDLHNVAFPQ